MSSRNVMFRKGDWVEVKAPAEIALTLDANGTLDGLPFMPEMLDYCGKRFLVLRQAHKTCVEIDALVYESRGFRENDVVLLDGLRCSGAGHDGCGRLCMIFWKTAWLLPVEDGLSSVTTYTSELDTLRSKLRTMTGPNRYFCQSTELASSTQPLTRAGILLKCYYDVRMGNRGVFEMAYLIWRPLWRRLTFWYPRRQLLGILNRTPVGKSNLCVGDHVEIKAPNEIAETLDRKGRNRGLSCVYAMSQLRGPTYQVRGRLDRMITEPTGEMRQMESTVILEGLKCLCYYTTGGCPREEFMYWRELWLNPAVNCGDDSGKGGLAEGGTS